MLKTTKLYIKKHKPRPKKRGNFGISGDSAAKFFGLGGHFLAFFV
jgi:hypothetical protein